MEISDRNHQSQSFILLINVKMPTTVGILTFMSRINFMLSLVEHEIFFITSLQACYANFRLNRHSILYTEQATTVTPANATFPVQYQQLFNNTNSHLTGLNCHELFHNR